MSLLISRRRRLLWLALAFVLTAARSLAAQESGTAPIVLVPIHTASASQTEVLHIGAIEDAVALLPRDGDAAEPSQRHLAQAVSVLSNETVAPPALLARMSGPWPI